MSYYTNLFSPETYQAFSESDLGVTGFRTTQQAHAKKVNQGDRFVCYMTKLSRWIGILEVTGECYIDESPTFYEEDDPFVVRFPVQPKVWLPREKCIPIHEQSIWDNLSFTRGNDTNSSKWTGVVRRSLNRMVDEDGKFLESLLLSQESNGIEYPIADEEFRKLVASRVRRADGVVSVTVPKNDDESDVDVSLPRPDAIRKSSHIQAVLARCGESMGFKIWLPRSDRSSVLQEWAPEDQSLIDNLPMNYDNTTLQTIENIDVLWIKGRSIIRAFEVEHTTAIYSGILRMADLLALQPNMDIKLHIVAPEDRKRKVFEEICRPVFSFLERAPLSMCCTFLSYDAIEELLALKHISHVSDSILDEYAEVAE